MERKRKTLADCDPDYKYNPQKAKSSSNNLKHKIPHFEWTTRMILQFIWIQITRVAHKLFKNPKAAKKNNGTKKRQGHLPKAMIYLSGFN